MDRKKPIVCLLTDFGLEDNYVASMKGALLKKSTSVEIIDITHKIPPQNVRLAAFQLFTSYYSFPAETLFISVVDPGVGSDRKIIYAESMGYKFIAPDNGLLSFIFEQHPPDVCLDISNAPVNEKPSQTFHGRDIMAPVAGDIINGKAPKDLGAPLKDWIKIPFPAIEKMGSRWTGEIIAIDRYGNLITNFITHDINKLASSSKPWFDLGLRKLSKSYAEVDVGQLLAIGGSSGFLEIALRDGSAAKKTGKKEGDTITIEFKT